MWPTILLLAAIATAIAAIAALAVSARWARHTGVPPHPSTGAERRAVVALLGEATPPPGPIYELGAGFGGLARTLARAFPAREVRGLEVSPVVALIAAATSTLRRNLRIRIGDIERAPLAGAGAVTCYLMPEAMTRLAVHLDRELAAGTPVVSVAFGFPDRRPERCAPTTGGTEVRLYRWPAR